MVEAGGETSWLGLGEIDGRLAISGAMGVDVIALIQHSAQRMVRASGLLVPSHTRLFTRRRNDTREYQYISTKYNK